MVVIDTFDTTEETCHVDLTTSEKSRWLNGLTWERDKRQTEINDVEVETDAVDDNGVTRMNNMIDFYTNNADTSGGTNLYSDVGISDIRKMRSLLSDYISSGITGTELTVTETLVSALDDALQDIDRKP